MTNQEEDKIRKAFAAKDWNDIKASDSWQIFKIMSEFVDGFEKMSRIGPCVTIFGSARTKADNPYYKLAEEIAFKLTREGYGVITGGDYSITFACEFKSNFFSKFIIWIVSFCPCRTKNGNTRPDTTHFFKTINKLTHDFKNLPGV